MNIKFFLSITTILFVVGIMLTSCVSQKVERKSIDTVTDLSGRWNDTDSRLVSQAMIDDMLNRPWLNLFSETHDKQPVIITGYVKNRSSEHIETQTFLKDIERTLLNSAKAVVVANKGERKQIREEKEQQQDTSTFETIKKIGQEIGADYMLTGSIVSQYDARDRVSSVTYQVDLELTDIENNQKVWIGTKKIKKVITRKKLRP